MATLQHITALLLARIQSIGTVLFLVLLLVDIFLYRIHPLLGFLGSIFIVALLLGYIH